MGLPALARSFALVVAASASLLGADGPEARDLFVGYETSVGTVYEVEFTARVQDSPQQAVFDVLALKASPSSQATAVRAHLQPGEVRELLYPLSQLVCVVNRKDLPLRALLDEGYAVRGSFDLSFARLVTPEISVPRR